MKCKHCGTYNLDDYIYCHNCGKKLHQKEIKEIVESFINKLDKKTIAIVLVAAFLLLGVFFGIKTISNKEETFSLENYKTNIIEENGNCYIYEENIRKAKIENTKLNNQRISFDQNAMLLDVISNDEKTLYVYHDGKLNTITKSHDQYLISDNGAKVFFNDDEDGAMYLYDVKSKKSSLVLSEEDGAPLLYNYVLSSTGNYLAYTLKKQDEDLVFLYSSKGTITIPIEERMAGLIGVTDEGQVIYNTSGKSVRVCDKSGDTQVIEEYDVMYINRDYTQIAARHDKEFYLYKNKKTTILTFDDDKSKITEIITPVNTQKQTISQKNNGNVKGTVTHIALDSFEDKFLRSTANKIYIVHKNNIVDTVVEKAHEYVLSKDGKQLYYKGEYENIICYSNGKNKDYFNGHAGVKKIYAYDYVNKGLYFSLEDENFCYSNGKNTTLVSEQEPAFTLFCNDGYLYYFDDSNLYAADKGKSRIVMEEVPDFEKIIDKYNTRSEHGVFYQADNGSAYFINKGTAKQIVISD